MCEAIEFPGFDAGSAGIDLLCNPTRPISLITLEVNVELVTYVNKSDGTNEITALDSSILGSTKLMKGGLENLGLIQILSSVNYV